MNDISKTCDHPNVSRNSCSTLKSFFAWLRIAPKLPSTYWTSPVDRESVRLPSLCNFKPVEPGDNQVTQFLINASSVGFSGEYRLLAS